MTYSIKGSFEGGRVYLLEPVDPPESGEKLVAGFVGVDGNMVTSPVSEPFFLEGLAAHCVCAKKDDTCWYTFATE